MIKAKEVVSSQDTAKMENTFKNFKPKPLMTRKINTPSHKIKPPSRTTSAEKETASHKINPPSRTTSAGKETANLGPINTSYDVKSDKTHQEVNVSDSTNVAGQT
jgi:hypothetical protein